MNKIDIKMNWSPPLKSQTLLVNTTNVLSLDFSIKSYNSDNYDNISFK